MHSPGDNVMTDELELYYDSCEQNLESLFQRIDDCGGWPFDRPWLTVKHCVDSKRDCYFSKCYIRRMEYDIM